MLRLCYNQYINLYEVSLVNKRKKIAMITALAETTHVIRVMKGVTAQCEKYGYDVLQFAMSVSPDFYVKPYAAGERRIYEIINPSKLDGVIIDTISLMYGNNSEIVDSIYDTVVSKSDIPAVCIGIPYRDIPVSESNNDEMLRALVRHAVEEHGCKDICVLTGMKGNHEAEHRLEVIVKAVESYGLSVSEEHKVYGDFWYTSGEELARDIVSGKVKKPDCLIASSDHMALGLIEELTKLGKNVPEYMTVLGFEATAEAALADIPLTSVGSGFAKCAAQAVDMLRRTIDPELPVIPYEDDSDKSLHKGASCGCVPDIRGTLEVIKSKLYYTERNYTADVFEDNIDIGLLMENYIPEQLTSSEDPSACIKNIYSSSYIISPYVNFFLCLRQDWLDTDADLDNGAPDKTDIVLARSHIGGVDFGDPSQKITFDTSDMIPELYNEHDKPYIYYFTPVHFSDKTLGYAVLQRKLSDYPKFNLVYRNWIRFVNNALEMARTKNRFVMLSVRDNMTGLYNRRGMYKMLDTLTKGFSEKTDLLVSVVDMDGLKYINDTFGHNAGDAGIKTVSDAVLAVSQSGDVCARTGGDEFCIISRANASSADITAFADSFCQKLLSLSKKTGKPFPISASIGCAAGTVGCIDDFEALLSLADENMYRFKIMRKKHRS